MNGRCMHAAHKEVKKLNDVFSSRLSVALRSAHIPGSIIVNVSSNVSDRCNLKLIKELIYSIVIDVLFLAMCSSA